MRFSYYTTYCPGLPLSYSRTTRHTQDTSSNRNDLFSRRKGNNQMSVCISFTRNYTIDLRDSFSLAYYYFTTFFFSNDNQLTITPACVAFDFTFCDSENSLLLTLRWQNSLQAKENLPVETSNLLTQHLLQK